MTPDASPRSGIFLGGLVPLLLMCGCATEPRAPMAPRIRHDFSINDRSRVDEYYWLRNRGDKRVIEYLEAENAYTQAVMKHTEPLQQKLFAEMKDRIKETDQSVPVKDDDYYYYTRTFEGKQYPVHCRKRGGLDAAEEVILDENALAVGRGYFRVGVLEVSPDHNLLAYSADLEGDETYTLRIKDLRSGDLLPDVIENTYYSLEWGNDNRTLFYNVLNDSMRPFKIFRHTLGKPAADDVMVHHESDDSFFVDLSKTRSRRYILLEIYSNTTSEVRVLDADAPNGDFRMFAARRHEVEYEIAHQDEHFYIVTNDGAKNFKLMRAPLAATAVENWTEVIAHRPDVLIDGVDAFADHLAIYERQGGLPRLRLRRMSDGQEHYVEFPEPVYTFSPGGNAEYQATALRFVYQSMVTPQSTYDYDMNVRTRELRKRQEVLGGYDPSQYETERLTATAPDGTAVPISIVHRKGIRLDGSNPLLLYGYGSYGASMEPRFSFNSISLLDRGYVYAIAHIRGGQELGRGWYDDGKLLKKRNTFTDFIACAEKLIADGYTQPRRLAIMGGSAGGLLIGAVVNMRPELFEVAVAQVPFVDVMNTMLDASIPLTVIEYEEWGNPNQPAYYDYMMSYSPYDNVGARAYPNMLVTAGLNDPRVQYWEPAKWVARLRSLKTDRNRLLLKTIMGAGHGGPSGRYDYLHEIAFIYAFILDTLHVAG
jgi:oligopeptidase B